MEASWRHVSTHLERDRGNGRLAPETRWMFIWGLALSTNQTHSAIALLLAQRNRPRTLPLQASILVRSLVEALGNIMALVANRSAFRRFAADGYRRRFEQLKAQRELFGDRPEWSDWLDRMDATLKVGGRLGRPGKTSPQASHQDDTRVANALLLDSPSRQAAWPTPCSCSTKRESRKTVRRGVSPVVFAPLLPSSSEERCRTTGGLRPPSRGSR